MATHNLPSPRPPADDGHVPLMSGSQVKALDHGAILAPGSPEGSGATEGAQMQPWLQWGAEHWG